MKQGVSVDFSETLEAIQSLGMDTSTATVQRFDGTTEEGIERKDDSDNWDDLADHVDIECMVASDIYMTNVTRSFEAHLPKTIAGQDTEHVLLMGFYPTIRKDDRLIVTTPGREDRTLDITGVEHDSQNVMTRLEVRIFE